MMSTIACTPFDVLSQNSKPRAALSSNSLSSSKTRWKRLSSTLKIVACDRSRGTGQTKLAATSDAESSSVTDTKHGNAVEPALDRRSFCREMWRMSSSLHHNYYSLAMEDSRPRFHVLESSSNTFLFASFDMSPMGDCPNHIPDFPLLLS